MGEERSYVGQIGADGVGRQVAFEAEVSLEVGHDAVNARHGAVRRSPSTLLMIRHASTIPSFRTSTRVDAR